MPHPYGEAEAEAFITGKVAKNGECQYAVSLADNGAFIGAAGADALARDVRGAGDRLLDRPALSGAWAMRRRPPMRWSISAFRATEIEVLTASCRLINPASRRVIQKCGFPACRPGHDRFADGRPRGGGALHARPAHLGQASRGWARSALSRRRRGRGAQKAARRAQFDAFRRSLGVTYLAGRRSNRWANHG